MRTAAEMWKYIEDATEGPWVTGPEGIYWPIAQYDPGMPGLCKYADLLCSANAEADAEFCINAREDLPRVLADAQALRGVLDAVFLHAVRGERIPADWHKRASAVYRRTAYLVPEQGGDDDE